ncbi:hypothetical protein [Bacillus massiliigorillae]|uniref:hypothetical protein n=1 Tax=Bacillus massiliigorillae TaxID=1243664 RepID=UPI0003A2DCE6|nr:hypothetical protein [Bacillus massiliigorillae]
MKRVLLLLAILTFSLVGCSDEKQKTFDFNFDHVLKVVETAYGKENIKVVDDSKEKGFNTIVLPNKLIIQATIDKDTKKVVDVKSGITFDGYAAGNRSDMLKSFQTVFNIVDSEMSIGNRDKVMSDLNINIDTDFLKNKEISTNSNIDYSISPYDDNIVLSAKPGLKYGKE